MEMGFKSRNNVRLTEGAVPSVQSLSLSAASAAASGGPSANAGVQVKPTLISIGTQTEEDIHSTTTAINHVTSTPVKNDEEDEQSSFDFDSHQWDSSWSLEEEEMDTDTSEEEAQDEEQRNTNNYTRSPPSLEQILNQLKAKEGGLILAGDCRSDSPGHCAKFGTYTVIEERINKVLDLQLVQSSEVPNSNWCELEGLKRTINLLSKEKISVSTLVTDRNRQVAKWVREKLCPEGTKHFFDIWHVSKGLKKALDAASKEQHCEDLALWKAAVITIFTGLLHPHLMAILKLLLAALHFNHNSNREVLRSDCEVRHQVRYPRFMKGTAVVRPMKETPSYEYAFDLMEHLHRTYSSTPEELRQSSALLASSAPQPLTASFQKVPKEEAVRQYKALHSRFSSQ
uniref:Transposase n=2 Tax=Knipowitschia caucasica TaxID=637954 RepID=A0AAV2LQR1_KNICA